MPTAPIARRALAAAALLFLAACRIERAPSGRPPGSARTAADSLTRVEQDSASADLVRAALRAHYRDDGAYAQMVEAEIHTYGGVAQAWVVYRARAGGTRSIVDARYGVDAFNLERVGGAWRIVHQASTAEDPARPLAARRP